jgi:hypothetical protein
MTWQAELSVIEVAGEDAKRYRHGPTGELVDVDTVAVVVVAVAAKNCGTLGKCS